MTKLDAAMDRVAAALSRLEAAVETGLPDQSAVEAVRAMPVLRAERDHLAEEVEVLRARAEEDLRLRAEAASAVRDALRDLRGAVTEGAATHA